MLEEEERSSAANPDEVQEDRTPEPRHDERAGERRGVDAEATAGDSVPDSRQQPGPAEVSVRAESPQVEPASSSSSLPPSETPQVVPDTHAVSAGTGEPKPQG
jgi:hypothetical protein